MEGPEKFLHPQNRCEISNLVITELFYSHVLNMNTDSLHTKSFGRIHLSVLRYRLTKNGFACPKSFRDFRETGPRAVETASNKLIVNLSILVKKRTNLYNEAANKTASH